ncbi:similar to Saccharomyces cerevisiae YDL239C ADY3 Protein required for spore wall formation [Maudiozyma saulgeensis]|uniref:Similar to Saccharomyces cerevisiae YDL239C ADY3 Protein required for spore wall formation n=1 Tax=Maudiozyma saulgeensis TaxID=1789683 RepID=A0A1X7R6P4_9SACH|nr:similar to Saccharomyces cerevisiae YDL239C ADY3 Protein required for spore wall formation [Kazachstania saulgeensis]
MPFFSRSKSPSTTLRDNQEVQERKIQTSYTTGITGINSSPTRNTGSIANLMTFSSYRARMTINSKLKEGKENASNCEVTDSVTSTETVIAENPENVSEVIECTTPGEFKPLQEANTDSTISNFNDNDKQNAEQNDDKTETIPEQIQTPEQNQENIPNNNLTNSHIPENLEQMKTKLYKNSKDKDNETNVIEEQEEFQDAREPEPIPNENVDLFESSVKEMQNPKSLNDPSKKKITELRKETINLKTELKIAKKNITTLEEEKMTLKKKLENISSKSQEKEKSLKQLRDLILKLREETRINFNNDKKEIMKCKEVIPEILQNIKNLESSMQKKQELTNRSLETALTSSNEIMKKKLDTLFENDAKKAHEYERQLNCYAKAQEQVEYVILNLRLFEVDLSEIINDILKEVSENDIDEDKDQFNISKLFEKKFKEQHNSIIGFRTKDDNYILGEMSLFLDKMKVTINEKMIRDVEKCVMKLNSTKDQSYLAFEKKIAEFQGLDKTQKSQIVEVTEKNNTLKKMSDRMIKEKNIISANLETQTQLAEANSRRLAELIGDETKKITYEQMLLNNSDTSRDTYDFLEVDDVDKLTMVELQNVIKNLIILLNIPFSKLAKKIPLIGIYLIYERNMYAYFVNRLYYQLNGKQLMLTDYNREAFNQYITTNSLNNIRHPLEECLETLCNRIITKL